MGLPLHLAEERATFEGPTQNARVLSEGWVADHLFCPRCGHKPLSQFAANQPVADFACSVCAEQYELKSQRGRIGAKVVDGAWGAMTARLEAQDNPNLLLMARDRGGARVTDLIVVPKQFFTPEIIERRPPLKPTARRAGWVGCNILVGQVPEAGRVPLVRGGVVTPKAEVLEAFARTLFLRDETPLARGWLLDVLRCVERTAPVGAEFTLADVYAFEDRLARLYPSNNNVRPKIRQQLQVLRDGGLLEFVGRGRYRRLA